MVMLEPLISLIVCSCLGGEARRPGPDPTDWHGLVKGGWEGRREEHGKEGAERRGRRMKERAEQVEEEKKKVKSKSGGAIRPSSLIYSAAFKLTH